MRKNDLSDFDDCPDQLLGRGFSRSEQSTTDPCRLVWYSKAVDSNTSQIRYVARIEFWLQLTDEPFARFDENRSYSFNAVWLDVYHRQMEAFDNTLFDDETERPRRIASTRLKLCTMREVESLLKLLTGEDPSYFA